MIKYLLRYLTVVAVFLASTNTFAKSLFPQVHRYVSVSGWSVNSYIIEGKDQLVIIDGQLFSADAKKFAAIAKSIGKPVSAAFITHPHSDHFAGFQILQNELGKFPVYTSQHTANEIGPFHKRFLKGFGKSMIGKIEKEVVAASAIEPKTSLTFGDIELQIEDLGAGEASNNIVVYMPQQKWLFTGDITMNHGYYYVGEGRSKAVLEQYQHLKQHYGDTQVIYSGHGELGRFDIIDTHIHQVETVRSMTLNAMKKNGLSNKLTKKQKLALINKMEARFPSLMDYGYSAKTILSWNVAALERELQHENSFNHSANTSD